MILSLNSLFVFYCNEMKNNTRIFDWYQANDSYMMVRILLKIKKTELKVVLRKEKNKKFYIKINRLNKREINIDEFMCN